MLENGLLRGEYYTYDTLNYFITGQWEMLEHDQIYLKADQYIDATFNIEVVNSKKVILSTEKNHVTFFNIGDVKSVIRLSRDEPGNYEDTRPQGLNVTNEKALDVAAPTLFFKKTTKFPLASLVKTSSTEPPIPPINVT